MQDGGSASIHGEEDGHSGPNSDPNPCSTFLKGNGNGNGSDNAVIKKPPRRLIKKKKEKIYHLFTGTKIPAPHFVKQMDLKFLTKTILN